MAGESDKLKGRVKEAAGIIANDDSLEREGKIDRAVGSVKHAVATVVETVRDALTRRTKSRA